LTIVFLVPGFLWRKTAQVTSRYATKLSTDWFECLTLSCFNYLLAAPAIWLLLTYQPGDFDFKNPSTYAGHPLYLLFWLLLVFALPIVCGWGTSRVAGAPKVMGFLRRFGIVTLHPAPTAWDYVFARDERYWARIELGDGTLVEGILDSNSLASTEPEERDVFLESVFKLDAQTGEYKQLERNAGVLVKADEIRTITFFTVEDEEEADEQTTSDSAKGFLDLWLRREAAGDSVGAREREQIRIRISA